jgi:hypothetical protein
MYLIAKYSKTKWGIMLLFVFFNLVNAQTFQNLVPNGSFETFTNCPYNNAQIQFAVPWTGPTVNGSDYFNACSNSYNVPYYFGLSNTYLAYLEAKDGNAYAGIYTFQIGGYREYIECKLVDSFIVGQCYYVEFFATSGQYIKYRSNNIAASFSDFSFISYSSTPIPLPQYITNFGNEVLKDTVKWEKISGLYKAVSNNKYIIIGNFKNDSQTDTINNYTSSQNQYYTSSDAYVLIDAVSVFSINPTGTLPWQYRDTTIVQGDSVYIGNTMGGDFNPQWFSINGNYIATNAGIYVKPAATTSYVVNYTVCGTPRSDTVEVKVVTDIKVLEFEKNKNAFKLFPNPAQNELEIVYDFEFIKPHQVLITDILGREVKTFKLVSKKQKLSLNELPSGVYYLTIDSPDGNKLTRKLIKE